MIKLILSAAIAFLGLAGALCILHAHQAASVVDMFAAIARYLAWRVAYLDEVVVILLLVMIFLVFDTLSILAYRFGYDKVNREVKVYSGEFSLPHQLPISIRAKLCLVYPFLAIFLIMFVFLHTNDRLNSWLAQIQP
jgi:hypothetical protein